MLANTSHAAAAHPHIRTPATTEDTAPGSHREHSLADGEGTGEGGTAREPPERASVMEVAGPEATSSISLPHLIGKKTQ